MQPAGTANAQATHARRQAGNHLSGLVKQGALRPAATPPPGGGGKPGTTSAGNPRGAQP
jgi:hypothetical protein